MIRLTNLVLDTVVFHRRKWATCCDQGSALSPVVNVFRLGFMQPGRVAQGEDDRSFHMLSHLPDDILREGIWSGRCSDQDMRFHRLDDTEEVQVLLIWPLRVVSCERYLRRSQLVLVGFEKQPRFIKAPVNKD